MSFYIERNNQRHGPYDLGALRTYVETGVVLLQDKVVDMQGTAISVRALLRNNKIRPKIKNNGGIFKQIKSFGTSLLLPKDTFSINTIKSDKRLLMISLVGLAPAFLIKFTGSSIFTFYALALYFSLIWGLFYYSVFSTSQVSVWRSAGVFFLTQILIFVLVFVINIPGINPLYKLTDHDDGLVANLIGYTLGVGVFEEFVKLLPVYLLLRNSNEPLIPQTVVFYGLMSGIGFGVEEGVVYQLTLNKELGYGDSYFMNIARLTCLPFLHSIWSGISAYFLSFSFLSPTNRYSLWILAISIPALLHGIYDTLGWSIPGLLVCYLSVALLIVYLKSARNFQSKMVR
jgi:RsiW-degrading membrane proteinase PrsW (M82 family)